MAWLNTLLTALQFIGVSSFRLGNFTISATNSGGAAHHLTLPELLYALALVAQKKTGQFTVGSTTITIAPYVAAAA